MFDQRISGFGGGFAWFWWWFSCFFAGFGGFALAFHKNTAGKEMKGFVFFQEDVWE